MAFWHSYRERVAIKEKKDKEDAGIKRREDRLMFCASLTCQRFFDTATDQAQQHMRDCVADNE